MRANWSLVAVLGFSTALAVAYAAPPRQSAIQNSYHIYTGAFDPADAGVIAVPSRFKWSVETSWRGEDAQGQDLPDSRVMMRLYDPDHNFTALTAQMDLATAEKLQRELAEVIAKKRKDPTFQYRPQLYESSLIPTGRLRGINAKGEAIIELEFKAAE